MRDKKLQVFVSSTYTDLKGERQAAVEAILSSGNIPAGMELFAAGDETQMTVIERWIDESDIYLLILGGRYGSLEPKTGKSYTHLEYEYALENKKALFAVVINDDALESKVKALGSSVKENENPKELRAFRALVTQNLVKFWDDTKDIKIAIHETLAEFGYRKDLIGWIRGDNALNTAIVADEIARLTKENAELRSKVDSSSNNALYLGFTFDELAIQLKRELYEENVKENNAFDYLWEVGAQLIDGYRQVTTLLGLMTLRKYKIIQSTYSVGNVYIHKFTNDGHAFYLKALYNNASTNN